MQFGSGDFVKLFSDFGETEAFELVPAVRHPDGSCIEEQNCDFEKATVCAFDNSTVKAQVDFLACMDEQRDVQALPASRACAPKAGLEFSAIAACFNSDHGEELLEVASKKWNKQFPGPSTVPHTFVNNADVQPTYLQLKQALCADGSLAPVCSGASQCTI